LRVRTDLPEGEMTALCARLERALQFAERYWGRELRGQIECYVVHDLAAWSDAQLPHRLARVIVSGIGGATLPRMVSTGKQSRNCPRVYASSQPGVAEHEIIHAYCVQTFGSAGPEWYKEGMAEMLVRGCTRESGVHCSADQVATLRGGAGATIAEILSLGETGRRITAALARLEDLPASSRHVPSAAWTPQDADAVSIARDEYLRSWAFCYLLLHNPNYAPRFRSLGNVFVEKQRDAFDEFFSPVREQIEFEHRFFLEHLAVGYRVDLCRWDWSADFRPLQPSCSHTARVAAARGFQASGLTLSAGQRYHYRAAGAWSLSADGGVTDADGEAGRGRLVGVVLSEMRLGKAFPLGVEGSFHAPADGLLYLRCEDAWNELADNQGHVDVTFQ